jgi:hypothetical protein
MSCALLEKKKSAVRDSEVVINPRDLDEVSPNNQPIIFKSKAKQASHIEGFSIDDGRSSDGFGSTEKT